MGPGLAATVPGAVVMEPGAAAMEPGLAAMEPGPEASRGLVPPWQLPILYLNLFWGLPPIEIVRPPRSPNG